MNGYMLKRPIDVVGSAVGLLVCAPLMTGIALWVRKDSPGPVLFRQKRIGTSGLEFEILKFRTMVDRSDSVIDQDVEQVISAGSDSRITRAGRVLRATSLDELPQLVNIFRGDMSIVGPRPIIPEQRAAIPSERHERFNVRPGLTGLAQVRGRRGLDWLDQLAFDAEYSRTCSLSTDLRIIARTVRVVLTRSGVYGGEGSNWRAYRLDRVETTNGPGSDAGEGESR